MASRDNLDNKLLLLEQRLTELGHVPSQKENRALYANTKYYYTNYPNHPVVIRLMKNFSFASSRIRQSMTREESVEYLQRELTRRGKIPGPTEDRALYSKVKYFYENYSDIPEISELMVKFPLVTQKRPSQFAGMTLDEKIDVMEVYLRKTQTFGMLSRMTANVLRYYENYSTNPRVAKLRMLFPNFKLFGELLETHGNIVNYFMQCFELYGEIPGERSIPMGMLIKDCRKVKYRLISPWGKVNQVIQLVIYLTEQGIESEHLKAIYNRIER